MGIRERVKIGKVGETFGPFATIEDAVIATDTATGKSKGFAIIMIRDPEIGRAAVKATQGKRLLGKTLTINEVVKKGKAAVKAAKEVRQGPFGPHFNRQSGGRAGGTVGGMRSGGLRRGMNRGPRGPSPVSYTTLTVPTNREVSEPGGPALGKKKKAQRRGRLTV